MLSNCFIYANLQYISGAKKCLYILNYFIDFSFAFQYYVRSLLQ